MFRDIFQDSIKFGLQPFLLCATFILWWLNQNELWIYPILAIGIQLILGALEYSFPARNEWLHNKPYKILLSCIFVVTYVLTAVVVLPLYAQYVNPILTNIRISIGFDIWPGSWPMAYQVLLAFFLSEFIWYWLHRAEHRWQWLWRLSGHGSHHAFKKLGAINAGANHPLELLLVLSLPSAIVELVLGAGLAVAGSTLLVLTSAYLAHSNLVLNEKVVGWLFTVNKHHIHHHSVVHAESNTNFGCAAIVWDRIFGTFSNGRTLETGVAPTEPSLWEIIMMPIKEPRDVKTAPRNRWV